MVENTHATILNTSFAVSYSTTEAGKLVKGATQSSITEYIVTVPCLHSHEIISKGVGQVGLENLKMLLEQFGPLLGIEFSNQLPKLVTEDGKMKK